jgi:hypothetical protein
MDAETQRIRKAPCMRVLSWMYIKPSTILREWIKWENGSWPELSKLREGIHKYTDMVVVH